MNLTLSIFICRYKIYILNQLQICIFSIASIAFAWKVIIKTFSSIFNILDHYSFYDIMQLFEALTRTEVHVENIVDNYNQQPFPKVSIHSFRKWIVKMWYFGVDSIDEYSGKEFEEGRRYGRSS